MQDCHNTVQIWARLRRDLRSFPIGAPLGLANGVTSGPELDLGQSRLRNVNSGDGGDGIADGDGIIFKGSTIGSHSCGIYGQCFHAGWGIVLPASVLVTQGTLRGGDLGFRGPTFSIWHRSR